MGLWDRFRRAKPSAVRMDSASTALVPAATSSVEWGARFDSWASALTGFGDPNHDKRLSVGFFSDCVNWIQAQELWRGDDMAKRIIEKPAKAMYRKSFECKIPDKDKSEAVAHEHKRLGTNAKYQRAKMYEAAYGGGAVFPVINSSQNLSEPLNEKQITEIRSLQVYEPRELQPSRWYSDPGAPKYGEPEVYRVVPITTAGMTYGSGVSEIHESRLITWPGIRVTRQQMPGTLFGWGDSRLTAVNNVLRDYGIGWSSAAALLHDFSQAVYKKAGLAKSLQSSIPGSKKEFQESLAAIELGRSTIRATVIDGSDSYERQQTPINGLSDLLREFAVRLAAAAEMPVVVLMGVSSAGLNATGESDVRLWYDSVAEAQIDETPRVERLNELIMLQRGGPMRGTLPKVWSVQWCPLWQQSDKEKVDARKVQADIDVAYIGQGVYSAEEVALARFGGDEYSFDMHIDFKMREKLEPVAPPQVKPEPPPGEEPPPGLGPDGEPLPDEEEPPVDENGDPVEDDEPPADDGVEEEPDEEAPPEAADTDAEDDAAPGNETPTKAKRDEGDWDEDKHPRAADGKFGSGSGETKVAALPPKESDEEWNARMVRIKYFAGQGVWRDGRGRITPAPKDGEKYLLSDGTTEVTNKERRAPKLSASAQKHLEAGTVLPVATKQLERFNKRAAAVVAKAAAIQQVARANSVGILHRIDNLKALGAAAGISLGLSKARTGMERELGDIPKPPVNEIPEGSKVELRQRFLKEAAALHAVIGSMRDDLQKQLDEGKHLERQANGARRRAVEVETRAKTRSDNPANVSKELRKDFDKKVAEYWAPHAESKDITSRGKRESTAADYDLKSELKHPKDYHPYIEARDAAKKVQRVERAKRERELDFVTFDPDRKLRIAGKYVGRMQERLGALLKAEKKVAAKKTSRKVKAK